MCQRTGVSSKPIREGPQLPKALAHQWTRLNDSYVLTTEALPNKKCLLKFSLLKKAILGLGVWEPKKYFNHKSVHFLKVFRLLSRRFHNASRTQWKIWQNSQNKGKPFSPCLLLESQNFRVLKEQLGPNIKDTTDQYEIDVSLGLPDTLSQYSFFQQAKFKRALLQMDNNGLLFF